MKPSQHTDLLKAARRVLAESAIPETQETLEEGALKNLVAASALMASTMIPSHLSDHSQGGMGSGLSITQPNSPGLTAPKTDSELVSIVRGKYRHLSEPEAHEIVKTVRKHASTDYPKAEHLLAIIGIESRFDKTAKSGLRRDPARGLTQVRPGVNGMKPKDLRSIDAQVKVGAGILRDYYNRLQDEDAAVHAYNVGIGNHRTGKVSNPEYVARYSAEKQLYFNK